MNRTHRKESVETIEAMLFVRRLELFLKLGISGHKEGHYLVALNPTRADRTIGSFKINLNTGMWKDFSTGEGAKQNPMIALICMCAVGNVPNGRERFVAALDWARDFLGLTGREPSAVERAEAAQAKAKADQQFERERETKRHRARRMFFDAIEMTGADPASLYFAARGIDVTQLAEGPPSAIRFHPSVRASDGSGPYPAAVCAISLEKLKGGLAGVQRIYLKQAGGRWVKAREGSQAKESLGAIAGGCVRVTRGASGKRLWEAPAGEWAAVTEGPEDALSIAKVMPHLRVLTPCGISHLAGMVLPPQMGGIWICAQNDAPGSAAETALLRAAYGLRARGLGVKIVRMPDGYKDPNEVIQMMQGGSAA
jgi:hypothetical protein